MILTVVSFKLDNSTGTVADGTGVAVPVPEIGEESGAGETAEVFSGEEVAAAPLLTGRLQAVNATVIARA